MLRDQVMFEHIEDKLFLSEELEAEWLVLTFFLSEFLNQIQNLFVNGKNPFFAGVGKHNEKVKDSHATLDDPVDQICAELLTSEIIPHWNFPGFSILSFPHKKLISVKDQLLFEEIIELKEIHLFGFLRDEVVPILHDLDDRPEDAVVPKTLGFTINFSVVVELNVHKSQLL